MILTCNSCGKKFVVPDSAITASGRTVQCGSCGNKWKQFPLSKTDKNQSVSSNQRKVSKPKTAQQNVQKSKKIKKVSSKKSKEISLYSPEYLAKKHGININETKIQKNIVHKKNIKVSFGFYSSLIIFIFFVISFSRILYFSQNLIISYFPISEFYLNYFFESINNIFEIWKNLIIN